MNNKYSFIVILSLLLLFNIICVKSVEILVWSGISWSGYGTNDFVTPNYVGQHVLKKECPIECKYTSDRGMAGVADGILFEAQPFASWSYTFLKQPPLMPQKEPGQLFVNFGYEHEKYFPISGHPGYLNQIDVNSTFRGSDQVQITFACSWGSGENGNINNFLKAPKPWSEKKGLVGFMSTNCNGGGAIYRTCYIREMMNHMPIDALGECMNNKALDPEDNPHAVFADLGDSLRIKERVLSKYKFSLAFENNNITDYVTEKVYTSLLSGSIPIYMGAPNIDEWVPEYSIIKTDDFTSPKHLVDYILYLSNNETAYNEYFNWKKKAYPPSFVEKYNRCIFYDADCRLCQHIQGEKDKFHKKLLEQQQAGADGGDGTFRINYGETLKEVNEKRVLVLNKGSCVDIKQNTGVVGSFNDRLTVMFWAQIYNLNDEKVLLSIDSQKFVVSITTIWKRYYLKVCLSFKCFIGETPLYNDDNFRHFAITIGVPSLSDIKDQQQYQDTTHQHSSASTIKIYIDGLLDSSSTTFLSTKFSTSSVKLGCTDIIAKLDDLSIWSTNLDQVEIGHAMFKKYMGNEPNHLLYMTFNSPIIKDVSKFNRFTLINSQSAATEFSTEKKLILKV